MSIEQEIRDTVLKYLELKDEAESLFKKYAKVKGISYRDIYDVTIEDENYIGVEYEEYPGCSCCPNTNSVSIPMSYLWNPNWEEKELEKIEAEKKAAKEKEEQEEADRKRQQAEYERKTYERLKLKFEKEHEDTY